MDTRAHDRFHAVWPYLGAAIVLAVLVFANRHVFIPGHFNVYSASAPKGYPLPKTWPRRFPIFPHAAYLGRDMQQGEVSGEWYDRAWFETRTDATHVIEWYSSHLDKTRFIPVSTDKNHSSATYTFASGRRVVDMEIFIARGAPTDFSVDFLPPRRKT